MKNLLIVALIGWAGYSAYTLYVEHPAEKARLNGFLEERQELYNKTFDGWLETSRELNALKEQAYAREWHRAQDVARCVEERLDRVLFRNSIVNIVPNFREGFYNIRGSIKTLNVKSCAGQHYATLYVPSQ